jgi:hypothetical protein
VRIDDAAHRWPRTSREAALTIRLSIDRFEGDKKQIAVLLAEDGTAINFSRVLRPRGVKAGDTRARIAIRRITVRAGLTRR